MSKIGEIIDYGGFKYEAIIDFHLLMTGETSIDCVNCDLSDDDSVPCMELACLDGELPLIWRLYDPTKP